ncbi:hypothetical protein EA472_05335 [Natrarchaeobius oligotrophus]|uniref:Uncharacterized protein n=1 Tax=Natrarchaeobius chitinivorans TaxID=1679083 RepID=A0A3N6MD19_NATCH|nr:hypothetical protein EA472_05335 [Natrarchaeobius chitinivorans]
MPRLRDQFGRRPKRLERAVGDRHRIRQTARTADVSRRTVIAKTHSKRLEKCRSGIRQLPRTRS